MKTPASRFFIFGFGLCGAAFADDPPGIPEPALVIYGTVTDGATNQPVTITSVTWQVTDGSESATLSAASTPPARIVTPSGQSFYLIDVPFDTRTVQTAAGQPLTLPRNGQSLELKSPSPAYTLTPVINGRAAVIRSIDGVPVTGATLPLTNTPETNGKIVRVDLTLSSTPTYEQWAAAHFPNPAAPEAARAADPDGDGAANEQECLAGTEPRNPASIFRITGITLQPDGSMSISALTIPGKQYRLLASGTLSDFQPAGTGFTATANLTPLIVPAAGRKNFYRLEVMQMP